MVPINEVDPGRAPKPRKSRTVWPLALAERNSHRIDPVSAPPDPALVEKWGAARSLRTSLMPWRQIGGRTVILDGEDRDFARYKYALTATFGPVVQARADRKRIHIAVQRLCDPILAKRAEKRLAARDSCRDYRAHWFALRFVAVFGVFIAGLVWAPHTTVFAVCLLAFCAALAGVGLKTVAALSTLRAAPPKELPPLPPHAELPVISVLVPLYREDRIAEHLLRQLGRLRYPRSLLDLCLVVERDDQMTQEALSQLELPPWARAITVPPGGCKTKPRALNYALDFTRGDIIGIYDAEDAPDPDQLLTVARGFAGAPPGVACLQGALDFYNSRHNWLARCFTLEYATWFRVVLPGIARLGLVIPLGGTTLFLKRHVIEEVGGWDAHNVTEDADLGIRLARHGYVTEMIPTTTLEEANARAWPWIKQRSRWLKGYAITYAVHMRRPRKLLRDLGWRRFIGIQFQFGGTLAAFVLAPVLWTFWMGVAGLPHPFLDSLPRSIMLAGSGLFILSEIISITVSAWAAVRAKKPWLIRWAPTLAFYFPLATFAAFKGLAELTWKPFYWDKTSHGIFFETAEPEAEADQPNLAASSISRVL